VKLRPKWSLNRGSTPAWCSRVRLLAFAAMLGGCSDLDPNIGPLRTDPGPQVIGDGGYPVTGDPADGDVDAGGVSFKNDIRPLFNKGSKDTPKGCKGCHYSTEANHTGVDLSGLDLATLGSLRRGGGSSGSRIVVPGKPAESVLVQVLKGQYGYANRMPKNGPYWDSPTHPENYIPIVEAWISQGAKGADGE
jgi:Planctomycete cytochrome C